jgi:hypothetical protein
MRPGQDTITAAIADQWTGHHCYLDDKPAIISGRLNRFATVATTDGTQCVEFAWHTVNRIMYGTMEFRR